ncbi:MAG: MarC family protein [Desulfurococcales archaeon]|nr:MarC family protein [Desulfurococcales archaeon]
MKSILMLFVVLDPVTVSPFYAVEASKIAEEKRVEFLNTVLLSALAMLVAFAVIGDYLFEILNVSFSDFRVAAGIILMIYAVASLFDIHIGGSAREGGGGAIVPLAVPLLAGPGSISTLLYIKYSYGYTTALLSAVVNIGIAYPIFYYSSRLIKFLGEYGISLVDKFMSLIMAGFAVSIIREGITAMTM